VAHLSEDVEPVDQLARSKMSKAGDNGDDRDATGESSSSATANLRLLMEATSSSNIRDRTPGPPQPKSSSSSMFSSSSSSSANNSSDTNPFEADLQMTLSVFKKKQDDEFRVKVADETAKREERIRRHLMQLQTQKEFEERAKNARSQQAVIGTAPIAQSDILVVTDIQNAAVLRRAFDQQLGFDQNSRVVKCATFFHIIQMFNYGDQDIVFKGVNIFDDALTNNDEQRWARRWPEI
jgi:hypothetical protein